MTTDGTDFTLSNAGLAAYLNLVGIQSDLGATTLTKAGLFDFAQRLHWCSFNYATIDNPHLAQQVNLLFQGLAATPTNWGPPVPALLVAYLWGLFQQNDAEWRLYYDETGSGITWQNRCGYGPICCTAPSSPPDWQKAVQEALLTAPASSYPPSTIIWFPASSQEAWDNRANIVAYEFALFDPARWADAPLAAQHTTALWAAQSADLAALAQTPSLTDQMCLWLLFALTGLCTSPNAADLARVNTIATLDTNSTENPNDTFIDQLVYFALMAWVDPKGSYQWTHDQLAAALAVLATVPNQDPGSAVARKTLTQQAAVLASSPSYPMLDPYNPAIGFPQRKTDTLAALNQAWAAYVAG